MLKEREEETEIERERIFYIERGREEKGNKTINLGSNWKFRHSVFFAQTEEKKTETHIKP